MDETKLNYTAVIRYETSELIRELVVEATLRGVYNLTYPQERWFLLPAATGKVDEGLVVALQDKTLPTAVKLQLMALRVYLQAKLRHLIKRDERDMAEADPLESCNVRLIQQGRFLVFLKYAELL
ncbi:hypothetical protein ACP70R_037533 [Stipagrostis hirtigluma subsp. patula]